MERRRSEKRPHLDKFAGEIPELADSTSLLKLESRGILCDPLACGLVMLGPVLEIQLCNFWYQWVTGVCIAEQGRDREQDLGDGESRAPLILQDVEAYRSICIHVAMINLCRESTLGRLEGVVSREGDVQEEDSALVW